MSMSPYADMSKPMIAEWDGEQAIKLAYYANVYVYRCVFQCAQSIAGLPFRVGIDPEKPDVFDVKNPLAKLLSPPPGGPNKRFSARKLWAWTVTQYIITGKWGWEIEGTQKKGLGDVVALWPLVSCVLNPVPTKDGDEYFSAYKYGRPGQSGDGMRTFTPDQVLYSWRPSAHDIRQPESALMSARLPVSVAVMQDRYDYAFLHNDARPAAIVVHEAFAEEAEREAFKRGFRADFRGPENSGKTMFIESTDSDGTGSGVAGALDIKVLGLSQRDAQFVQRYSQKIADICVALGTPLSVLGDSTKRTYDSANVEHRNWWEGTLQPLCADLADDVNMQLVPRMNQDEVGWFDFSKVKALQSDSRLLALGAILPLVVGEGKPITTTEFRDALGLAGDRPEDKNNEALLAASQPTQPDMTTGADGRPLGTPVGAKPTAGNAPKPGPPAAPGASAAAPGTGALKGKLNAELEVREVRTPEIRQAEWRTAENAVTGLEPVFEGVMRHVFERQATSVLSRLTGRRGRRADGTAKSLVTADIFDKTFWNQETATLIRGQYGAAYAAAHGAVNGALGVKIANANASHFVLGVSDPKALAFITSRADQLAGRVNDTTYDAIQTAMSEGTAAGESIPSIADRIQTVFGDASDARATMIARTEVLSAYNGSTELIGRNLPSDIVNGKEWLATSDDRTREDHMIADGQQVATGEAFTVGDSEMQYPGDPEGSAAEAINCRCKTVLLTPGDWNGPDWISTADATSDPALSETLAGSIETLEDLRDAAWLG